MTETALSAPGKPFPLRGANRNLSTVQSPSLADLKSWAKKYIQEQLQRGEHPTLSALEKRYLTPMQSEGDFSQILQTFRSWLLNLFQLEFLKTLCTNSLNFEILLLGPELLYFDQGLGVQLHSPSTSMSGELLSPDDYNLALELWAQLKHQNWNYTRPFASFEAEIFHVHFRATLIHQSLTPNHMHRLFLRRLPNTPPEIEKNIPLEAVLLIKQMVQQKKNILITGATASGKTTLMRSLVPLVKDQHVIVLEDVAEIDHVPGHTHMLSRENFELKDLLAYALRMRPDRIWLGEIRSYEVVPLFMALNTGHRGMVATLHADSAPEALSRLTLLFLIYSNLREMGPGPTAQLITQNIDYVIHMHQRNVSHIIRWISGGSLQRPAYELIYGKV